MLDFLFIVSAKKVVVSFAFLGALIVTAAPKFSKYVHSKKSFDKLGANFERLEKLLVTFGYSFVGLSITLFIIAGFIVDLR